MISFDVTAFGQLLQRRVRATPQPQGSQVLLRTLAEGANHADLHIWHGWYDLGQGKRLEMDSGSVNLPLTLGHEIAGEVAAMGPDAFMCKAVGEVIDCVGAERTVPLALGLLTQSGQRMQGGLFGGAVTLVTPQVPMRAISWIGSHIGSLAELQALWALMPEKRLRPVPVQCRCLDQAGAALQDLEHGRGMGRVVLRPEGRAGRGGCAKAGPARARPAPPNR